ncbi:hypothetical protein LPJ53_002634 [Coemansia erecta]|uniref:Uncharacterized protein n=1 Tax=Coemansia erecta TaxID=147472 RepID=A0A9W7XXV4_9FUNG|nr:hypothetical protein LPJ53_002634 [Coemansia erecta]
MARYIRQQYGVLRRSTSSQELDSVWGDILVHRMALQDYCSELIVALPSVASQVGADRWLWRHVYHEAISECRRRLRLHVAEHNLSRTSSISTGVRLSTSISSSGSTDGSSADHGALEEWRRAWWTVTLTGLFSEALGCFSLLAQRVSTRDGGAAKGLAGRLAMYVGDVYRYQYLYLPLVSASLSVACDEQGLLDMARGAYARAMAMLDTDGSRACGALALLAAYERQPLEAVYWHARALGCCHAPGRRGSACSPAMLARLLAHAGTQADDPLETLVVEYAHHAVCGSSADETRTKHAELLQALTEDLAEIHDGAAPLFLDREYWAAEYQVAVVLASLGAHELAIVQMQRHVALVRQLPDATCPAYALTGLALWIDMWRAQPSLLAAPSDALGVARMLGDLIDVLGYTDEDMYLATEVLAHDLPLRGWPALAPVHQDLAVERTLQEVRKCCGAVAALSPVLVQNSVCTTPWDKPQHAARVVCARAHLLLAHLPHIAPLVRIPDKNFCARHTGLLATWAAECTVVALPGMPLAEELKGVVWADARLVGSWDTVDRYLVADEDDEDMPTADDVPESARALIACALHWTHHVENVSRVEIASDDEELAFYASWFGIVCIRGDGQNMLPADI